MVKRYFLIFLNNTEQNTEISPSFLVWKSCGNAQFSPKTLRKLHVSKNTKMKIWKIVGKLKSQHHIITIKSIRMVWENIKANSRMITARNTVMSSNFLVWKTVLFNKISTPENQVKLRYFMQFKQTLQVSKEDNTHDGNYRLWQCYLYLKLSRG